MSKSNQVKKNLVLSTKFATYIAGHPEISKKYPSGISYVVFTESDLELNKLNEDLVESLLLEEGKIVVTVKKQERALETTIPEPVILTQ